MTKSILSSDRVDRYEFEVFISQADFTKYKLQVLEENAEQKDTELRLKASRSVPNYRVKIVLDDVLKSTISDEKIDKEQEKQQCLIDYNDKKLSDSFTNIVKKISMRYKVEEKLVCNGLNLCYNVKDDSDPDSTMSNNINRGVVCIFNCVPRMLITIFQKNPLKLTMYDNGEEFGRSSIMLSGVTGFTNAITHHFYQQRHKPYTHMFQRVLEIKQNGTHTIGKILLQLKLTCHGPRPNEQVDRIIMRSNHPPLQPIHVDLNEFDFHLDKPIVRLPPKMMFCDTMGEKKNSIRVINPEIKKLLSCRSIQESLANETSDASDRKPCSCPCKDLMEKVKKLYLDDASRSAY